MWSRFGPYHLARIAGLSDCSRQSGISVTGLEVARRDEYDWEDVVSSNGIQRITLFPNRRYESISKKDIGVGIFRVLERLKPSAVVVNGWSMAEAIAGIVWCRLNSVNCVLMSETIENKSNRKFDRIKKRVKSMVVGQCGAALVGGREQSRYLVKLGFPRNRIFLGYDAVDNSYFETSSQLTKSHDSERRQSLGLPDRYFFACTRFLKRKNIDGLLRAYALYRHQCADSPWDLVVSGSGQEEDKLRALARSLCPVGVHWPGFLQYDQLPTYYALASAFIHPALAEAWGLVVNEAAACGLPLLVGDTVGSRYELVHEGENGFLFVATDVDDICRAMCAVSALSDDERRRMGLRSQEIVAEWSPRRFGEQLLAAVEAAKRARGSRDSAGKRVSEPR